MNVRIWLGERKCEKESALLKTLALAQNLWLRCHYGIRFHLVQNLCTSLRVTKKCAIVAIRDYTYIML